MSDSAAPPRAVLFDWDGTLVDNWPVIRLALNDTLVAWGREPWSMQEVMERVSQSQRDSFPLLFGDTWEAARDHFYARFEEHHLAGLELLPEVVETLDALREAQVWIGLVSNKRGDYLRREVSYLGWDAYFGGIVGANDASADKPSAAPVHLVLDGTGHAPGPEVWFVGDSATDMQTARNAGCTAILVRHPGANPTPLPQGLAADVTVERLGQIAALARRRRASI
ncbi:MAG: HAD family hydrolase [Alphaproteobacteria bacterium]